MNSQKLKILLLVCSLGVFAAAGSAQSRTNRIYRPCAGSTTPAAVEVERNGDISLNPCSDGSVRILDKDFTPLLAENNYLSIGTNSRFSLPAANDLTAFEISLPLTVSGSSKYYIGQSTWLDFQGTAAAPQIYGNWLRIDSNSLNVSSNSRMYGYFSSVDVGTPIMEAFGGYFSVLSGGSGASGAGTLTGVAGVANVAHNGNTTNAFAGDFWLASSTSSPSVVTTASAVRARASLQSGVTASSLRGLALTDWVLNGGGATNSYGIYADTSIDIGTSSRYFIYSLSTSPSVLNGDLTLAAGQVRVATPSTPASASAACSVGQINWDTGFVYICTAANTWKRAALSTW